MLEFKQ